MKNKPVLERLFIFLLTIPVIAMIVGMFFNLTVVGTSFFLAAIISAVITIIDRLGDGLNSNSKLIFIVCDVLILIALLAICYFESFRRWNVVDILLTIFAILEVTILLVDIFYIKNGKISKHGLTIVDLLKFGTIVCILAYFFKVSSLWFAIDALVFESSSLVLKIVLSHFSKQKAARVEKSEEENIESRIHSAGEDEKDPE